MPAKSAQGFGCAVAMVVINALLIGLLAFSFGHGPYSSGGQELWYRYGALGFLLAGAILPAVALILGARRSSRSIFVLTAWMLAALMACFAYAGMSGGGV